MDDQRNLEEEVASRLKESGILSHEGVNALKEIEHQKERGRGEETN